MASGGGGRRRKGKPRARARARGKGKGRKAKYLSLSDLLVKAEAGTPGDEPEPSWEEAEVKQEEGGHQQQMEPFVLHHEASTLFAALAAPSLSEILGAASAGGGSGAGEDESPSPSASPDGASGGSGLPGAAAEEDLARRALRGRERWVYCSSGSASSPAATTAATATTSASSPCSSAASTGASARSLLLKLDYEEILAAWAGRGSLYIGGGGGADGDAAPELELGTVLVEADPSEHAAGAAAAAAWSTQETAPAWPERAEKVRRFKEKRRNRLFAKRIRYEVRRVNAVKRPRFKGRFIKHEESELQPT